MVRVKHRYILFDILYPPNSSLASHNESFHDYATSQQKSLLTLHRSSSPDILYKNILSTIRKSLETHYGELGAGSAGQLMSVRYFSNKTSTGIIRCDREQVELIIGAMTLITKIDNCSENVIFRCLHVSGTIKKCEEFGIEWSKQLMNKLGQKTSNEMKELVTEIGQLSEEEYEELH
ncbi:conserved hypothetical protein [Lodderomyces elongisporus NRRL YB-4239]|uniref:Ribonuclease P/MRP protein subunit POP5 n=1 Tax=Lodderomyces elongisporus (strain ATCC 11503 / CBS 2605 / JCM 1781 / NBRC 1676 / NRRL YB-4239) TaxID=379508 RepID=A5DXB8_LODEL|nr:conserved hypothetical protein [Lodderomyces elongisporus NRRL YB-4239]